MSALWNLQLRNPENGRESQHFRVQVRHLGGGTHWVECESILEEPPRRKGVYAAKTEGKPVFKSQFCHLLVISVQLLNPSGLGFSPVKWR